MSKGKKLNLTISELSKITIAVNENIIANRNRIQEDKINTDTYIRQFGISRKDFSETIKDTNINYNKSTFQYDIKTSNYKSDTLVTSKENNKRETLVIKSETLKTNLAIVEFEDMKSNLVEMLAWYKQQRSKENIIDIEIPIISIDRDKLTKQAITRGFKIYPDIITEFKKFCKKNSQYTMQDLMAMSLIEYINKYSK